MEKERDVQRGRERERDRGGKGDGLWKVQRFSGIEHKFKSNNCTSVSLSWQRLYLLVLPSRWGQNVLEAAFLLRREDLVVVTATTIATTIATAIAISVIISNIPAATIVEHTDSILIALLFILLARGTFLLTSKIRRKWRSWQDRKLNRKSWLRRGKEILGEW